MTKKTLAYIAGFFDGEGTISVYKNTGYQSINSYFLYASVSQKKSKYSLPIARALLKEFGGSYYESINASGSLMWRWQINRKKAVPFLKAMYPLLIVKKEQARLALKWQANKVELKPGPIPATKKPEIVKYLRETKKVAEMLKSLKR